MSNPSPNARAFLDQPWPHGVIAAAASCGDDAPLTCPLAAEVAARVTPEFWKVLDEALTHLAARDCAEATSTWVFETALLWVNRRDDGDWAALLVTPDLPSSAREFIQGRLQEFAVTQPALV